jgi:hypothetical protein
MKLLQAVSYLTLSTLCRPSSDRRSSPSWRSRATSLEPRSRSLPFLTPAAAINTPPTPPAPYHHFPCPNRPAPRAAASPPPPSAAVNHYRAWQGSESEIKDFVKKFSVSFPMMSKSEVRSQRANM